MMDYFRRWLASLKEAERSAVKKPVGMSRRSFLGILGITAVTLSMGGIVSAATPFKPVYRNYDQDINDLVTLTLRDLGEMKFSEIAQELQNHVAMRRLLKNQRVAGLRVGVSWDVQSRVKA